MNVRGTVFAKDTGRGFRTPAGLANYLRINESALDIESYDKADTAPEMKQEGRQPFVRYANSPNVFDRQTGRHIGADEAEQFEIFQFGMVQQFRQVRPEVKSPDMQASFEDKDLTILPV